MRLWRVLTKILIGLFFVVGLMAAGGAALAAVPPPGQAVHLAGDTSAASSKLSPCAARADLNQIADASSGTASAAPAAASDETSATAKTDTTKAKKSSQDAEAAYVLGTGDKLHINIFGQHDLDGNYLVDGSGNIQFPLIGQVKAAGKTVPQLQQTITAALSKGYLVNPSVSIEVTSNRPFYILGEVKAPGQYPYVMGMSVITAVALAGGYTFRADESDVYVRRAGSDKEVEMPASEKTKVEPGDIIRVPERFF